MKRNRNEIISVILNICMNGASKIRVVYQANLNFRTVDPYLQLLIKNDLLKVHQGQHVLYETTEKGICLMNTINQEKLLGGRSIGESITLIEPEGGPVALLVSLKPGKVMQKPAIDWDSRMDDLAKKVSRAWKGEKSAVDILSEMRR